MNPLASPHRRQARIRELGSQILARARAAEPTVFSLAWWNRKGMEMGMRSPRAQAQLFRFIEVLPMLRTSEQVADALRQFLGDPSLDLPPILRLLLSYRSPRSPLALLAASAARHGAPMMARGFICGKNMREAIASVLAMRRRNMAFTMDILGEGCASAAVARDYVRRYVALVQELAPALRGRPFVEQIDRGPDRTLPRANVSIKLSALCSNFDPVQPHRTTDQLKERVRIILRTARKLGAFINFDMEQAAYVDITTRVFKSLLTEPEFADWQDVGIVVQAYLVNAEDLATDLIEWCRKRGTPITVRLVKGAYWDSEVARALRERRSIPVWTAKWESDACFERISELLVAHADILHTALASHNVRSLAAGMEAAERRGLDRRALEFQMLAGMGDPLKHAIVRMGYRLRVYAPFGELVPGMAYLIRRLLENTSNDSFLRQSFGEVRDEDELLQSPERIGLGAPDTALPRSLSRDYFDHEEFDMPAFENVSDTDFAKSDNRQRFTAALASVRNQFGREHCAVIGGSDVATGEWFSSVNPARPAEIIGRVCNAGLAEADSAVNMALKTLPSWRGRPPTERADALERLAGLLAERRFELAACICLEVGKGWLDADAELSRAIDSCRFYAREMLRISSCPGLRNVPGEINQRSYVPRGVVAVIGHWDSPLAWLTGAVGASVVAGNTVVLHPAPQAAVTAAKLAELFAESGLPPGVVNFCPGTGSSVRRALVAHPDVAMVAFSGNRDDAARVRADANAIRPAPDPPKHLITEMGGNNAIIVDLDAELGEAVRGVMDSALAFAGQDRAACTRAVVLAGVYETFIERVAESARSLVIGPAEELKTDLGPVIDSESRRSAMSRIETAASQGRLVFRGDVSAALESGGYYVPPAIFADLDPASPLASQEVPGPLLAVLRADNFEQALDIANRPNFALVGGLYSRSPRNIERARREFAVGNLFINRPTVGARIDRQPLGGLRISGMGRPSGGSDYLLQFMQSRTITENTMRHGMASADAHAHNPVFVH